MDADVAQGISEDTSSAEIAPRYKVVMRHAIQQWRYTDHEFKRLRDRFADRAHYRLRREAEGKSVRHYRPLKIETQKPGEDDSAFEKRVRKERRRRAEGKPSEPRGYMDLSGLSPDLKKQREREQNNERQRKKRALTKASRADHSGNIDVDLALQDLDMT